MNRRFHASPPPSTCTRRAACSSSGISFPVMSRPPTARKCRPPPFAPRSENWFRKRIRKIHGATASLRKFCRRRAYPWPGARLPSIARLCRSPRPTTGSERRPARLNVTKIRRSLMQLDLSGHHVEVTESLRAYVLKKFERISRHFEQLIDVHCVLTVERFGHKAEATLMLRGNKIYADATETNMYASIDALADKLDRCVKKHKEKAADHHAGDVIKARSSV